MLISRSHILLPLGVYCFASIIFNFFSLKKKSFFEKHNYSIRKTTFKSLFSWLSFGKALIHVPIYFGCKIQHPTCQDFMIFYLSFTKPCWNRQILRLYSWNVWHVSKWSKWPGHQNSSKSDVHHMPRYLICDWLGHVWRTMLHFSKHKR